MVPTSGAATQQLVEVSAANTGQRLDVAHGGIVGAQRKAHVDEVRFHAASSHVVDGGFQNLFFYQLEEKKIVFS